MIRQNAGPRIGFVRQEKALRHRDIVAVAPDAC